MSGIYKITEVVAISDKGFTEAVQDGVQRAAKTIRRLGWFEVVEQRGLIKDGHIAEFQVTLRLGFKLEEQ